MGDFIKSFWDSQASKFGTSHNASWGDNFAIDLEIQTIGKYIKANDDVLDIGCANGFSALHHIDKNLRSLTGIDFSEAMITEANKNKLDHPARDKITFQIGDVRKVQFDANRFDVVYTTRTLINLPTWEEQKVGISECLRVCKTGGTVVLSEAFWEPLVLLNSMRGLLSLPPLVEHDFNRYLKHSYLATFLAEMKFQYEIEDFSSVYYLGSRFLRDLVTRPNDYPGYSNPINKDFYDLEIKYSGGGFGIQQAYVIRK